MQSSNRKVYILLAWLLCLPLHAQTGYTAFRHFMNTDGLSDNTTLCGLRDSYGFMWVGTADGLNCYDGQHNRVFRQLTTDATSLEGNQIMSLLEVNGDIWCGGTFGLYVYHRARGTFSRFTARTRYGVMVSSTVQRMVQAGDCVWLCTLGQGVFIYDLRSQQLTQDSRGSAYVTDVSPGSSERVCLTSLDGRLLTYSTSGHLLAEYTVPGFVSDKNKVCVSRLADRIFVGSDQGLYCLMPGADRLQAVPLPASVGYIRALLAEDSSHLLLGTDHGLYRYQTTTATTTRLDDPTDATGGLTDDCINALLLDREGTLWVFTQGGGVCYRPAPPPFLQVHTLPARSGGRLPGAVVRSFCPMADGTLYVGTDEGLFRYHPASGQVQPVALDGETHEINTLMADGDDLWVGTRNDGVLVLSTTTGRVQRHVYSSSKPYTVPSNEINRLFRTRGGHIFVATSWGISRFDREGQRFMGFSEINSMTPFVDMAEDSAGNLWAATANRGLFCMAAGSGAFTAFTTDAGLHSNAISALMADRAGRLWVAHKDGTLQLRQPGSSAFADFQLSTPEQPRQIHFLMEDDQQRLWLGTDAGILTFASPAGAGAAADAGAGAAADDGAGRPLAITPALGGAPFSLGSSREEATMQQGLGYVGYTGFFVTFDPRRAAVAETASPVYVASISFPYVQDSHAEVERLGLDRPLYTAGEVRLPYALGSLTLHFAAPHFTSQPVHYEYMLRGYDRTWAHGTRSSEVTYTHLPPGDYEFLLRDDRSTDPATYARLRLTVQPPWYRTLWALLAYVAAVLAAIALIAYWTSRSVRRRYNRRIEAFRLEQEKENFQSKINFFINLVHEIRTPLTLISLPLEQMEQKPRDEEEREHYATIRRNMNYLLGITNQLLDFQKAENGRVSLQTAPCDLSLLLADMAAQFTHAMEVRGIRLQCQLPEQPVVTILDRDKMNKVIMNLLGNALKYAHSEVILRLEELPEERLRICVIDDGPGIPDSEKNRIFDLYHQIADDHVAASLGTGLGLAHARMLVEAHGGTISAQDVPGGGTVFEILLAAAAPHTPLPASEGSTQLREIEEPARKGEATIGGSTARTLLLVEDNEELLKAMASGLRQQYRVLKARDGVQALDLLRHQDVDLIVSDVMMPHMDGIELCQQVKGDVQTSHIPVILLTAKTAVEAKVEGMRAGADVYLEKPFAMQQLQLQLQNILRMRQLFHQRVQGMESPIADTSAGEFGLNEQDLRFMQRLQELVEKNMRDEQFSIDSLAEQMNMSRSSFYRKIKALTDLTPVEYMKNQRLQRAATLLMHGHRITEVAAQVGFTSSSYFAKCFRTRYGVLPKDYNGQPPV